MFNLFSPEDLRSRDLRTPHVCVCVSVYKRIFEYIRIFEYFPPNIDIRIRFDAISESRRLFEYSNILLEYFRISVDKNH